MNNSHDSSTPNIKPFFRVSEQNSDCCPSCRQKAKSVPTSALNHFIKEDIKKNIKFLESFYFCTTPSCKVVYFKNYFEITLDDVKYSIGIKEDSFPATVCFCFNWTKEKIENQIKLSGETTALEEIKEHVKNKSCLCEVQNPKGKCCMSDVKKTIVEIKNKFKAENI